MKNFVEKWQNTHTQNITWKCDDKFFIQLNFIGALSSIFNCQTLFDPVEIYYLVVFRFIWFSFWNIIINSKNQHRGLIFQIECFNSHNASASVFIFGTILKINSKHSSITKFPNSFMLYCEVINLPNIILLLLILIHCIPPSTEIFVRWLLCRTVVFFCFQY